MPDVGPLAERITSPEDRVVEPPARAPCGTQAGYQQHLLRGEPTCPDCRRVNADRVRHIRETRGRPDPERERRYQAARQRAMSQLAKEHPDRYRQLLHEQLLAKRPAEPAGREADHA